MARIFVLLAGFGLMFVVGHGWLDHSSVRVTFLGSGMPGYDSSNFEDCSPASWNGASQPNDDCYAYLRPDSDEQVECDYNLSFQPGDAQVRRLRVKILLMRDGHQIGRDMIQINGFDSSAEAPSVAKTIRGECDADHLRITEAKAMVDGWDTDLIATDGISAKGLMPLVPDFFIKIGPAT